MFSSYSDLPDDVLYRLISIHQSNLAVLEEQAALFGVLNVPIGTINQIKGEQEHLKAIKEEIRNRGKDTLIHLQNKLTLEQIEQIIIKLPIGLQQQIASKLNLDKMNNTEVSLTTEDTSKESSILPIQDALKSLSMSVDHLNQLYIARRIITYAILGLIIMSISVLIIQFIKAIVTTPNISPYINFIEIFILLGAIFSSGFMLYGAYLWITSGGSPEEKGDRNVT